MKTKDIMKKFEGFTDGVRMIMLTRRNKEGGKSNDPDKVSERKVVIGREDFEKVLGQYLKIKEESDNPLRIYSCVNARDMEKGIREFKRTQLDNDYNSEDIRHDFYKDIENRFFSALMKPSSKDESNFLIDCDDLTRWNIGDSIDKLEYVTDVLLHYKTKNGYHIITKPFNSELLPEGIGEIKKDALLLLSY